MLSSSAIVQHILLDVLDMELRGKGMIYHIAELSEWYEQETEEHYTPRRFDREGFVHCSEVGQLERVANDNFFGRSDLLLLFLDPKKLDADLLYEGKSEKFPHIHGRINKNAVVRSSKIECNQDGLFSGVFQHLDMCEDD